jgi:hypothetical protein
VEKTDQSAENGLGVTALRRRHLVLAQDRGFAVDQGRRHLRSSDIDGQNDPG